VADANFRTISPDYLKTMRIPLRRGRAFTEHDTASAPPVALINETLARRFFGDQDAVGRIIEVDVRREIVGVVGDVRFDSLEMETQPEYYAPYAQAPERSVS